MHLKPFTHFLTHGHPDKCSLLCYSNMHENKITRYGPIKAHLDGVNSPSKKSQCTPFSVPDKFLRVVFCFLPSFRSLAHGMLSNVNRMWRKYSLLLIYILQPQSRKPWREGETALLICSSCIQFCTAHVCQHFHEPCPSLVTSGCVNSLPYL